MFRLPTNLAVGGEYQTANPDAVTALENQLPPQSRMLIGLVFAERYEGFLGDCQKAEAALRKEGIPAWPELDRIVTPDPDGEPVVWVGYVSSPAFWTVILMILGAIFLLPVLSVMSIWVVDWFLPGFIDLVSAVLTLFILGGLVMLVPRMLEPPKKKKIEPKEGEK